MQLLNLPDKLLLDIGEEIQSLNDVEVLSRANRRLHNLLTPELYHRDARLQKSVLWAARVGRLETLRKAQSFGIVSDSDTGHLLYLAAENGQVSILQHLLPVEHGWVLNWASCPSCDIAATPLAAACYREHHGAVKVLLDHGADHSIASRIGRRPLHVAASGADVPAGSRVGWPLICLAVDSENLELVEFLLSKGCDPIGRTPDGETALHKAARRHHLEMCKLLISHGSEVSAKTDDGSTVLDWAAIGGKDTRMVKFLLEAGAEIGTTNVKGVSALHVAASYGPYEVVRLLINAGYDVNLKTHGYYGYTPLHEATCKGHLDVMQVLLDNGADANEELSNGETLLHTAASEEEECVDAVALLVRKGANTAARNRDGETPLDMAISVANNGVVEFLSGRGPAYLRAPVWG
ncbi:hypothetical protein V493_04245 [Pseudogymnoascus sp. VKM F-4281 (FW-2241)]|nr:hypothetical protein V493_04245 [Pseudogymnoascus sp. VKM F-4281 (FW-2241)]